MYICIRNSNSEILSEVKEVKINLDLIKKLRKKKGYNIDQMAEVLGLTNGSMYWKRENGNYKFKAEELMKLANVLNVSMNDLFLSDSNSEIEIVEKEVG